MWISLFSLFSKWGTLISPQYQRQYVKSGRPSSFKFGNFKDLIGFLDLVWLRVIEIVVMPRSLQTFHEGLYNLSREVDALITDWILWKVHPNRETLSFSLPLGGH